MLMIRMTIVLLSLTSTTGLAQTAATTRPAERDAPAGATTRPGQRSAEETLRQMLQPHAEGAPPINPQPTEQPVATDATGGAAAMAPGAAPQPLEREGSLLQDRVARLTKSPSGWWELRFDADGSTMSDPPLLLLPNRKLVQLEDAVKTSYRDMKVWVSGEVTEYRGRNYLLLHRWSAVPDSAQPLQ